MTDFTDAPAAASPAAAPPVAAPEEGAAETAPPTRPGIINVAGLDEDAIADGPGLRFVVFVQGCLHHCPGCQNPQTHPFGRGSDMRVADLVARVRNNPLESGATFTGGDPMFQAGPLAELAEQLRAIRPNGFDIAIYTGYYFEALMDHGTPDQLRLLQTADILVDGPFLLARKDRRLRFRGSANQRILNLPRSLAAKRAVWTTDPDWIDGDPYCPV